MIVAERFTSADLLLMPDDGKRYEVIEGDLYVSRAPGYEHQYTCGRLFKFIDDWNDETNLGAVFVGPGLIFAEDDDVIPDVVWISRERFERGRDEAGHFVIAPELVIEVLSLGKKNEDRDRRAKLKLYSRRGVQEYWIVDWMNRSVEVYRRKLKRLRLAETLLSADQLTSPLLPGFSCPVKSLFFSLPEPRARNGKWNGNAD
jgi:Uma2 family endonuclease